jgi:class 3 adenylate cyclase/putative methionine-R-sulfoxide reductase with GAF domain
MRPIRNSTLGIGVVSGVVFYALIRIASQLTPSWIALDVVTIVAGGLLLGICNYLLVKRRLRRAAQQVRETAGPIAGTALPPTHADELEDLRLTYERTITSLARRDRYRAITDQLLSSDDLIASFRVITEHAARTLPLDSAALFLREDRLLRTAATWNLEHTPPEFEQDSPIWRVVYQNRPRIMSRHVDERDEEMPLDVAAMMLLPVVVADQPVGVLALASHVNPAAFIDEDLKQARFFAGQLAIAVRYTQLSSMARSTHNQVATLAQVARDLGSGLSLDEILHEVLTAAAALTASQHGTVLLLDETGEHVTHRIALDSSNMAPLDLVAKPILRQGLAGWAVRERRATLVRDTELDPRWLPGPGLGDVRSVLIAPLLRADRPLGVITLAHDLPGRYTDDHLQLLETLGAQAALAIERAGLVAGAEPPIRLEAQDAVTAPAAKPAPRAEPPARRDMAAPEVSEQPSALEVVAVFADLRGFTKASELLAPRVLVKEVRDVYIQAMAALVQQQGGYIDTCSDSGILSIFGYPSGQPDDTLRAVQAALAMRLEAARLRVSWRTRLGVDIGIAIGISRGRAIVSRGGAPERQGYVAIGDAVSLASRLQGLARAGEILAAAEVVKALDDTGAAFEVVPLPPLQIKGLTGSQRIYRIDGLAVVARQPAYPT